MSNKRGALLLALFAGALGAFASMIQAPREVTCQRKPLNAWLKELENWDGDTNDPAFAAILRRRSEVYCSHD